MFLTGFLTGFAEQAKDEIQERNKELRKRMDEQFKEHKRKYEAEYALKKEERRILKERSAMFQGLVKGVEGFDNLSLTAGQQLSLIANQKDFEQFRADITELQNVTNPQIKKLRVDAIKKSISGKTNIAYDNMDDAIESYTQVQDIVRPVAITNKTAFGLKSDVQQTMLDNYKASMPDAFKKQKSKTYLEGGYKGYAPTQKLPKTDAVSTVNTALNNKLNKIIKDPGKAGAGSSMVYQVEGLSANDRNQFKAELNKNVKLQDSVHQGSRLVGLDTLSSKFANLVNINKKLTALEILDNTTVDGTIGKELAEAIQIELDLPNVFGKQLAEGSSQIFVGPAIKVINEQLDILSAAVPPPNKPDKDVADEIKNNAISNKGLDLGK